MHAGELVKDDETYTSSAAKELTTSSTTAGSSFQMLKSDFKRCCLKVAAYSTKLLTYPHKHLLQRRHGNAVATDNYIVAPNNLLTDPLLQRTKQI